MHCPETGDVPEEGSHYPFPSETRKHEWTDSLDTLERPDDVSECQNHIRIIEDVVIPPYSIKRVRVTADEQTSTDFIV